MRAPCALCDCGAGLRGSSVPRAPRWRRHLSREHVCFSRVTRRPGAAASRVLDRSDLSEHQFLLAELEREASGLPSRLPAVLPAKPSCSPSTLPVLTHSLQVPPHPHPSPVSVRHVELSPLRTPSIHNIYMSTFFQNKLSCHPFHRAFLIPLPSPTHLQS